MPLGIYNGAFQAGSFQVGTLTYGLHNPYMGELKVDMGYVSLYGGNYPPENSSDLGFKAF